MDRQYDVNCSISNHSEFNYQPNVNSVNTDISFFVNFYFVNFPLYKFLQKICGKKANYFLKQDCSFQRQKVTKKQVRMSKNNSRCDNMSSCSSIDRLFFCEKSIFLFTFIYKRIILSLLLIWFVISIILIVVLLRLESALLFVQKRKKISSRGH